MVTVIDFYADWCGPCQQQDDIIEELEEDYEDEVESDNLHVQEINVDQSEKIANDYEVQSLPTIIIKSGGVPLEDGDTVYSRFVGYTGRDKLETALQDALEQER